MLTSGINLINFKTRDKTKSKKLKKQLDKIIKEKNHVIDSLGVNYQYSYKKKDLQDIIKIIKKVDNEFKK